MHVVHTVFAFCAVAAAVGCGSEGRSWRQSSGTVTFAGQPLKNGSLVLQVEGQRQSSGKIADGKIVEVTTFKPGDGAPVGPARIAVFATKASDWKPPAQLPKSPAEWTSESAPPMVTPSLIPVKYNDPNTSGLTCEIRSDMNELDLKLTPE